MRTPAIALAALLAATSAQADTLIDNVNGVQVDAAGRLERFTGILIGDDGKVKRLLKGEKIKLPGSTRVVDGGRRTMLPGLIDAHGHVVEGPGGSSGLGLLAIRLDLLGTRSLGELQARLRDYAANNPGGWIIGRGWNQELWAGKSFPTAADLDAVVADRPVWLERVDGHAAVANSRAMQMAGVTSASKAPSGGEIERDAQGNPTGLFIDTASELVDRVVPKLSQGERERGLVAAQNILLANGITTVADMGISRENWDVMYAAARAGRLPVRIIAYADGVEALRSIHGSKSDKALRVELAGVKLYLDGALGSRGAWLKQPYSDKPDTRGLQFLTAAEIRQQAQAAAQLGYQVAIHAIGDAGNAQAISVFEQLATTYSGDRRWRIEHVQVIDPADIPRLARAGIIASMQPTHQTSDRTMAEVRLGMNRLGGAYAWRTMEKLGVPLAFGSDFPVEHPNPFPGLSAAVSRQDPSGQPPGGWRPQERVSLGRALHGFTHGAAYAAFAEGTLGCLHVGCQADFIIVDRDPTKVDAQALAATRVLETWIGGEKAWASADASPAK